MSLNNFLLQYDKTKPKRLSVLRRVRDITHIEITYKKKHAMLDIKMGPIYQVLSILDMVFMNIFVF